MGSRPKIGMGARFRKGGVAKSDNTCLTGDVINDELTSASVFRVTGTEQRPPHFAILWSGAR